MTPVSSLFPWLTAEREDSAQNEGSRIHQTHAATHAWSGSLECVDINLVKSTAIFRWVDVPLNEERS
jgi:hypothetical protein